eukprot:scaffold49257_cov31-Tisochrysis_lutea.AAC.1
METEILPLFKNRLDEDETDQARKLTTLVERELNSNVLTGPKTNINIVNYLLTLTTTYSATRYSLDQVNTLKNPEIFPRAAKTPNAKRNNEQRNALRGCAADTHTPNSRRATMNIRQLQTTDSPPQT